MMVGSLQRQLVGLLLWMNHLRWLLPMISSISLRPTDLAEGKVKLQPWEVKSSLPFLSPMLPNFRNSHEIISMCLTEPSQLSPVETTGVIPCHICIAAYFIWLTKKQMCVCDFPLNTGQDPMGFSNSKSGEEVVLFLLRDGSQAKPGPLEGWLSQQTPLHRWLKMDSSCMWHFPKGSEVTGVCLIQN